MANLTQLAEQLVNLTVKEVKELTDILKDQYGIEPAAAGAVVVASAGGAGGSLVSDGNIKYQGSITLGSATTINT